MSAISWPAGAARRGALLAGLVAALGCVTPVQDRAWIETRSHHFTIYSTLRQAETEALARDLEIFRAAVGFFTTVRRIDSPIPIEIFVFGGRGDFQRFATRRNVAGFIRPNPRSYQVLLGPSAMLAGRVILYHEYVHFLVRNDSDMPLPRWYDEGFAEFLSTVERVGDDLVVGKPHPLTAHWLVAGRPVPVVELLAPGGFADRGGQQLARFYAWSWLLVRFLSWDYEDPEGLGFARRLATYLEEIRRSRQPDEALEIAWGLTPDQLGKMLKRTLRKGVKIGSLPLERLRYSGDVATRAVGAAEMAGHLGPLALAGVDLEHARQLYRVALVADPDDARAIAGLADTYKFENRMEEAEPLFQRAVELAPSDVLNLLDRAEYWLSRATQSEAPESKDAFARKALEDGRAALELAPGSPEALWVNGVAHSLLREPDLEASIRLLRQAASILPADELLLSSLLEVYVAAGRSADAENVAHRLMAAAHSKEQIEQIQQLLESGGAR